jgi:hypothetical protein
MAACEMYCTCKEVIYNRSGAQSDGLLQIMRRSQCYCRDYALERYICNTLGTRLGRPV